MTRVKTIRNIILSIMLIFCFALLQNGMLFSFMNFDGAQPSVVEASYDNNMTSSLSNNNFASFSSSSKYPYSPSSWTASTTNVPAHLKAGVINGKKSVFDTKYTEYGLAANDYAELPSPATDDYALMINTGRSQTSFGYTTNSALSLSANSYYEIRALVRTSKLNASNPNSAQGKASIYLTGDSFNTNADASLTNLVTNGDWSSASFYIATSAFNSENVGIGLYLGEKDANGSMGFVMFDRITVRQISSDLYDGARVALHDMPFVSKVDLRSTPVLVGEDGYVVNGEFSETPLNWTIDRSNAFASNSEYSVQKVVNVNNSEIPDYAGPGSNFKTGNDFAYMIYNKRPTSVGIKSSDILIRQHGLYRISFYIKTSQLSNNAGVTARISGTIDGDTTTTIEPVEFTGVSSYNVSNSTNGWSQYVFYVVGHPYYDSTVNLELWLGSPSGTTANGYAFFDSVSTQRVSDAQMTSGISKDTNSKTIKMYKSPTEAESTFANGFFNFASNQNGDIIYPLLPTSWTHITSDVNAEQLNQLASGVVNTSPAHWAANKANYPLANNPGLTPLQTSVSTSNNILMLGNKSPQAQSFVSTTANVNSNEYKLVSVMVRTQIDPKQGSNMNAGAYIQLKNDAGMILAEFTNVNSNGEWVVYDFYIRGNLFGNSVSLTLGLGTSVKKISGYAYFDNAEMKNIAATAYDDAHEGSYLSSSDFATHIVKKVDFKSGSLAFCSADKNASGMYNSYSYKAPDDSYPQVTSGVFNPESTSYVDNPGARNGYFSPMVLGISSGTDVYYMYMSNSTYSLNADSFYRLSIWVKTVGVRQLSEESYKYDEDGERVNNWGASISVIGIDQEFTAIDTKDYTHQSYKDDVWAFNDYKEYVFLINTTAAISAQIVLALGSSDGLTTGAAFFSDITLTSMTESEMQLELAGYGDNIPANVIHVPNTNINDTEDGLNPNPTPFDWLILPTLIFGVALIIAIVGILVRKLSGRRQAKAYVSTKYDRAQTLLKDVERRDMRMTIDHKIKLLKQDLKDAREYLTSEEREYAQQISAYNTAKEIARSDPEITLEKLEDKYVHFDKYRLQLEDKLATITEDISALEYERDRLKRETDKDIEKASKAEKPRKGFASKATPKKPTAKK